MKKQDAYQLVQQGETVYLVAVAYCRNKQIGQNILVMSHKPSSKKEFENDVNVFKTEFKEAYRFPTSADKLLKCFFVPARRFVFRFLKKLPKAAGIITENKTPQSGEKAA
jgi:hypothetical protein